MKRWRWDFVLASAIIAVAIVVYGFTHRFQPFGGDSYMVLDRLTGRVCYLGVECVEPEQPQSAKASEAAVHDAFDALWEGQTSAGTVTEGEARAIIRQKQQQR